MIIRIVPVGNNIRDDMISDLQGALKDTFGCRMMVTERVGFPKAESYNHWRRQYDSAKVLEFLINTKEGTFIDKEIPTLFILDQDLYYKDMTFIFGLEDPSTACSIVSLNRLKQEFYDKSPNNFLLRERVLKEAVHEIGHHFGLKHCMRPFCVMSFSQSVREIDKKDKLFCAFCKMKLLNRGIRI